MDSTTTAETPDALGAARPAVPLRRNLRFQLLWGGAAAAMLGTCVGDIAYPLLLLALTGSPSLAGSFAVAQSAALVLFGLHGGVLADRYDRRRILIVTDACRLVATLSVPLALAAHRLTVGHVLAVGAVLGVTMAYGGPVRRLAVRAVVPPEQLGQALVQDELRLSGASLAGPPLAGFLFGLGRTVPFLGTALASLLALAASLAVRFEGRPQPDTATGQPDTATGHSDAAASHSGDTAGHSGDTADQPDGTLAGLRYLLRVPLLRATLAVSLALNLAGSAAMLTVLVLLHAHGTSSTGIGFALAGEAVGGLLGAPLVARLHGRLAPGVLLLGTAWSCVPLLLVPTLLDGPVAVFCTLLLMMLGIPALRVMLDVLIFRRVPDELRGRVIAATLTALILGMPLGTGLAGLLLDQLSPATVLTTCAAVLGLSLLPLTLGRALRGTTWPAA